MSHEYLREVGRQLVVNGFIGICDLLSGLVGEIGYGLLKNGSFGRLLYLSKGTLIAPIECGSSIGIDRGCTERKVCGMREKVHRGVIPQVTGVGGDTREHSRKGCLAIVFGCETQLFLRLRSDTRRKGEVTTLLQGIGQGVTCHGRQNAPKIQKTHNNML